jgi:uncharacterized protein YndB with AHSA1/START domain
MTGTKNTPDITDRELVITRIIDAPRRVVFKAWTDPKQVSEWWGPHGMTTPVCEMDLKPGGAFRTVVRDPEGTEYPNNVVFLEIVESERIVFIDAYEAGWIPTPEPFTTVIITLEDDNGKTNCICRALHWTVADRVKHEEVGFYQGWGEMLERLETHVAKILAS